MQVDSTAILRLKVIAEADPGALVRALQFFQARNWVPQRVSAQRLGVELLEIAIEIDAADCTWEAFNLVAAKLGELPSVLAAVACE